MSHISVPEDDVELAPVGDWVGVNYLLPGPSFGKVKVRVSKPGQRCRFGYAEYIPRYNSWRKCSTNKGQHGKPLETEGWFVYQWFWPREIED